MTDDRADRTEAEKLAQQLETSIKMKLRELIDDRESTAHYMSMDYVVIREDELIEKLSEKTFEIAMRFTDFEADENEDLEGD